MEHEAPKTTSPDAAYNWVDCQNGAPPLLSVRGGYDDRGEPLYVGRVLHEGSAGVANVRPSVGSAEYACRGTALRSGDCQLLCGDCFQWVWHDVLDGDLPPHAVTAGRTVDGVDVFIGRGRHAECLVAGHVYADDLSGGLHVAFEGAEVRLRRFQVLTQPL